MESVLDALAHHALFAGMDGWYLHQLAKAAEVKIFQAGETIIEEGKPADHLFLITRGKISILTEKRGVTDTEEGPELTSIQKLSAGEILGWSWLIEPYEWRFDARAMETTELICLDGKYLRELCETDPKLGFDLLKRLTRVMTERLAATRLQLALHGLRPFQQAEGG